MTKEDLIFLSEFENNFRTAIDSNYSRNIVKSKLEKMLEIYKRVTGRNYSLCTHCTTSILTFLRLIGDVYFDHKNDLVQDGNETNMNINELQKAVTKKENKKKKKDIKNV